MGTYPYVKIFLYCAFYFLDIEDGIMANYFKYCTKKQELEFLESLNIGTIKTLYSVSNHIEKHYEYLEISKKNGGKRKLWMPDPLLKYIQKNILNHILYGFSISEYAKAYHRGSNIVENVEPHLNHEIIVKLDIKNFFDHITFDMVKNNIFKEEYFPTSISILLTQLCCFNNKIPQGAPTSPVISNMILKEFDETIGNWCKKRHITYTRYSDDLIFSGIFDTGELIAFVRKNLSVLGFQLNRKKTRILLPSDRRIITGIVVNQKLNTPRNYRKKLRQELYYCNKFGIKNHLAFIHSDMEESQYLSILKGKVLFVLHVNNHDQEFKNYLNWIKKRQ